MAIETEKIATENGIVTIPKNKSAYADLLHEFYKELPDTFTLTDDQSAKMESTLTELAVKHSASAEGKLSTVIKNVYFDFRTVLFESLMIAFRAGLAIPTHDPIGIADAVINTFVLACTRFSKLNQDEVTVYWALVQIERVVKKPGTGADGATVASIKQEIANKYSPLTNDLIESALRGLVERGAVKELDSRRFVVTEKWVK